MGQEQFEQMLKEYERLIYTICLQMVRDHAQAEDLVQETFLSAWIHRECCTPGAEKAWLCRIAANRAKDYLKSAYRRRVDLEGTSDGQTDRPDPAISAAELCENRDSMRLVEKTIDGMRTPYREVSALYFLGSYTVPEIARMLHRPDKTVHTQLYRARVILREGLRGAVA